MARMIGNQYISPQSRFTESPVIATPGQAQLMGMFKAAGIFGLTLLSIYFLPFAAVAFHEFLPRQLMNEVFFFPQLAFPYSAFTTARSSGFLFDDSVGSAIAILQWLAIGAGVSWLTRRRPAWQITLLAVTTVLVATYSIAFLLKLFGIEIVLDPPYESIRATLRHPRGTSQPRDWITAR